MQEDTAKINTLISTTPNTKMHYFKYLKNRRKFNNFRKKLAIAPFFPNLMNFKEKLLFSWYLTLFNRKKLKNVQKNNFISAKNL